MRYAPTEAGLAGCRQGMREGFFIVPPFRKADRRVTASLPALGFCRGVSHTLLFISRKVDHWATVVSAALKAAKTSPIFAPISN